MALKGGGPSGAVHRAQRGWRSANQLSVGPVAGDTWGGLGVSVWASCPLHMDSARPVEGAQSCARDTSVDRVDGYDFAHDMLLFLVGCVLKLCTDTCRWLTVVVSGKSDCMLLFVSHYSSEQAARQQMSAEHLICNTLLHQHPCKVLCRHVLGCEEEKDMASGLKELTDNERWKHNILIQHVAIMVRRHHGAMGTRCLPDPDRTSVN